MMPITASVLIRGIGVEGGLGKERNGEPQEAVGPHLEEDAGQDHAARSRRLGMRVGQPGMDGEHGDLDREGKGKGGEEPELEADGQVVGQVENVETSVLPAWACAHGSRGRRCASSMRTLPTMVKRKNLMAA